MKLCATCHKAYPDTATKCPEHGEKLKPDPLIGTTLGSFAIGGWLGEGGMGVLYRAEHTTIRRKAAVKVLKREFVTDESIAGRFAQEARAVAKIGHPHLIDIFDIGTTPDGRLYYVMELLEGHALADAMEKSRLPFATFGPMMIQACEALEAAHAVGIVHRDLKPDNLFLVERTGEPAFVKVLDFGVAKVLGVDEDVQGKLTRTGNIVGTPQYMAPEQIDGSPIDHRADVYALGVILYELSTGKLPFRAETIGAMLKAHLLQMPPPFEQTTIAEGMPIALELVTMHALAKLPEDRYATVKALREDLQRVMDGREPEAVAWRAKQLEQGSTVVDQQVPAHLLGLARDASTIDMTRPQPTMVTRKPASPMLKIAAAVVAIGAVGGVVALVARKGSPPPAGMVDSGGTTVAASPKRKGPDVPALKSKALGVLTAALKDGDPAVRKEAVETLAGGRDPRHRSLIEPLLEDADTQVRSAAAAALGALGGRGAVDALQGALGKDKKVDVAVAAALDGLGAEVGKKKLKEIMKKGDDAARIDAAMVLAGSGDKEARSLLQRKGAKAGPELAVAIDAVLSRGGDAKARAHLVKSLEDASGMARLVVAKTLARLGDEGGRAELVRVAGDQGELQLAAAWMLSTLDDQSGYDLFRSTYTDAGKGLDDRIHAAQGLGASGEKAALETLGPGLEESEPSLRVAVAGAVLAIAGADPRALAARSVDWATAALADGSWAVRESAVSVLGDLDASVALPLLGKAIHDDQEEVRRAAAKSLGKTRAAGAVPILGEALADQKGNVRVLALRSMGQVGKASGDKSAQAIITKHLEKASAEEKVVGAASLVKMGDKSHLADLKDGLNSADPEIRKLAVEEAQADPETAKDANQNALKDKSFAVRFAAATQLAEAGSKDGADVLQEAVKKGGADGLSAYTALKKLGVEPLAEIDPIKLLDSTDVALRVKAVEAGAKLEGAKAVGFLKRALSDADAHVRSAALDAAAGLGGNPPPGLALARAAVNDPDPAVRAKAGALVARLAPPVVDEDEAPAPAPKPAPAPAPAPAVVVAPPDLAPAVAEVVPDMTPAAVVAAPVVPDAAVIAVIAPIPIPDFPEERPIGAKEEATQDEARLAMSTGDVYLTAGKYEAAIRELSRAHKLDGKLPVFFALGEAYRRMGDRDTDKAKQKDNYGKAISWYKRAKDAKAKTYAAELAERLKE